MDAALGWPAWLHNRPYGAVGRAAAGASARGAARTSRCQLCRAGCLPAAHAVSAHPAQPGLPHCRAAAPATGEPRPADAACCSRLGSGCSSTAAMRGPPRSARNSPASKLPASLEIAPIGGGALSAPAMSCPDGPLNRCGWHVPAGSAGRKTRPQGPTSTMSWRACAPCGMLLVTAAEVPWLPAANGVGSGGRSQAQARASSAFCYAGACHDLSADRPTSAHP